MNEYVTAFIAALVALSFGAFLSCSYAVEKDGKATERVRLQGLAVSRDRCIAAGHAWVADNCIPLCSTRPESRP